MSLRSHDPASGETFATFDEHPMEEVNRRLARAEETFQIWKGMSFDERKAPLRRLAILLREDSERLGAIASREMGKPIAQAKAEVEKCASICEYYANEAERMLEPVAVATEAKESFVRFDPIGAVLAVMPWNFPFWQVMRFAAPALMAGNVCVLKHASNVPQCGIELEKLFLKAGFPEGCFRNLLIGSAVVEHVIRHPAVKAVTLTGSEHAGKAVAAAAGSEIKKTVLELGGSDPFVVLADADVEAAADIGVTARLQNAGQSCIAAKRFILVESIADAFLARFRSGFEAMRIGNPLDPETGMGPLATAKIRDELEEQVRRSVEMGAEVLTGGRRTGERGYFYAPTILTNIQKGMPAYDEELFGPVASVIIVRDEEEALRVANDTVFGLGSSLWTRDLEKARRLAPRLNAGCVFVNGMVKSDPRLPFGGIGISGYGRELSDDGLKEFVNVKTVVIQ